MCVCVCVCVCVFVCMYVCVCTCDFVCVNGSRAPSCRISYIRIYIHIHTHIHTTYHTSNRPPTHFQQVAAAASTAQKTPVGYRKTQVIVGGESIPVAQWYPLSADQPNR